MTTRPRRRDPNTRTVVRPPERDLGASVLDLAAPLLERLGRAPAPDEARSAVEIAVKVWNAHVLACPFWDWPLARPLATLRKEMCGKKAPPGSAETFKFLAARWQSQFKLDPRLVGEWSLKIGNDGTPTLACETKFPEGVFPYEPPPAEKRIAIGGKFLDEVQIRQTATTYLSFPVDNHRGFVADDGVVTIEAKMPTVVELFAEGRLTAVGGAAVEVAVGPWKTGRMVLAEVRSSGSFGHNDVAVLVFRPAPAS